jgi:hypothetical protein
MSGIHIIKHEAVAGCGSYEVRVPIGRSRYFYFEDDPGRRLQPELMTGEEARELATSLARGLSMTRSWPHQL